MKKLFNVLFCVISVVVTLGLCTAVVEKAFAENPTCDGCPEGFNIMYWSSLPSGSIYVDSGTRDVSFTQVLNWDINDGRTAGIVSHHSHQNVSDWNFTPDLFFPNALSDCCKGVMDVLTTDLHLDAPATSGWLKTYAYASPDYIATSAHQVSVLYP